MDYRDMYLKHIEENADLTIAMLPVEEDRVKHFGIMKVAQHGKYQRVTDFIEKPLDPQIVKQYQTPNFYLESVGASTETPKFLASMGIYIFKRSILEDYLRQYPYMDFGKEVIPGLIKEKEVAPYYFEGYWEDIGTIKAFHKANMDLLGESPAFKLYEPNAPIYTNTRFLPAAYVSKSMIHNTILSDGVTVKDSSLLNCVIGIRSIINPKSKMENVLMLGADYFEGDEDFARFSETGQIPIGIGEGTEIRNAIIDKNARIGKNVKIINSAGRNFYKSPDSKFYIDEGIIVIPKDAVITDNTII
jgi:glucose-1-phosphate adenylyltransferase